MPKKSKKKNKFSICYCLIAIHDGPWGPGKCAKRDISSSNNLPYPPQVLPDSTLGAEQPRIHSQTQSQGNIPLDNIYSPATTTTSDISVNNVFTQSSSNGFGSGVAMSQDMGAAILYQLQQLNINSGALSVLNASQHYSTVPGVSAFSVGQQNISSSFSTKPGPSACSVGQQVIPSNPCVSACSVGQQNISPNLNFTSVPNVGNSATNVGITSVGNTPCNIYSMHDASISALPSAGVAARNSMTAVPNVCTSTSHSGISSVPSVGTFLSAPSVPNMDTTYMGMSSESVITPHGISQKTEEQTVTGQYVDLSEFLPSFASSNIMNKTELEPYLDGSENLSYRPKKNKRKIHNFNNWVETWSHYEKLVIKYVGVGCHEGFVDYRNFYGRVQQNVQLVLYCYV